MHEIYKKHDIKKKEDMEQCIVKEAEKKRNEAEAILQNTHWIPGGKREQWITFITYSPTTVDEQREANKKKLIAWMHHGRVTMNAIMRNNVRNHCSPPITTSTVGFSMVIENPLKKGTAPCLTTNGQRDGLPDEEKLWVACSRSKAGGNEYFETCTTEALEHGNYRLGLYMFFNSFDKNSICNCIIHDEGFTDSQKDNGFSRFGVSGKEAEMCLFLADSYKGSECIELMKIVFPYMDKNDTIEKLRGAAMTVLGQAKSPDELDNVNFPNDTWRDYKTLCVQTTLSKILIYYGIRDDRYTMNV